MTRYRVDLLDLDNNTWMGKLPNYEFHNLHSSNSRMMIWAGQIARTCGRDELRIQHLEDLNGRGLF
jgi:hypothetical protein